jgi:hypothetical protein
MFCWTYTAECLRASQRAVPVLRNCSLWLRYILVQRAHPWKLQQALSCHVRAPSIPVPHTPHVQPSGHFPGRLPKFVRVPSVAVHTPRTFSLFTRSFRLPNNQPCVANRKSAESLRNRSPQARLKLLNVLGSILAREYSQPEPSCLHQA